ncbi:UDP-glucuronosyltransferase 2B15 [Agrilus planipennis]|uniref:UDP-glucuronosyltransferase n=1 Tax=Agrilus planipennis TaxID=224129 RepID=A0A1W4XRE9_AGRPL|nr:UDP-glucuronosyltransferase 2B15 [Agrilus planipennis]XP_018334975.1 UDP-glucuronosyltransferase 2B15 [Agrilus planipennis]XP_018334980.1 UDP-glucuronosyltransferase 2B15 [Agrilus planipennis]XP_018334988.1 UDP-glucuronosyltransferase 2B15 [Agrilus planipennis]XP_018334996.1 UDP-glucuronosyltransferase 2B15 [Agrilus planipennis]
MRLTALLGLLLTVLCQYGDGYRILGINIFHGKSHFVMFERLYKELAKRGHVVDVVSHFPQKNPPPRYNDLSIKGIVPNLVSAVSLSFFEQLSTSTVAMVDFMTTDCGLDACTKALNTSVARDLKMSTQKYDLIISEIFGSDCPFGYAYLFDVPVVTLTTSVNLPWGNDRFGNPDNPSYIPNYFLPYLSEMTLWERIWNTVVVMTAKFRYKQKSLSRSNEAVKNFFGSSTPELEDLIMKYSALHLVNSHYSINVARPWVPNVIEVGGLHIQDPKPLPEYFEKLMDTGKEYKGVVFLSLGSMAALETLPLETLRTFCNAFGQLPYKFLLVGPRDKMPKSLDIPKNVIFEQWMPQRDILCHPNLKLFVTHGGLMGSQEGVYCGVPMLAFPIFVDQHLNIRNFVAKGLALKLSLNHLTTDSLLNATRNLLEDPQYKENAQMVSHQFRDRPLSAADTAVYWVEYVIRHKGARQLRSVGATLPWYQYHLLDVAAVMLSVAFVTLYSAYVIIRRLVMPRAMQKLKVN